MEWHWISRKLWSLCSLLLRSLSQWQPVKAKTKISFHILNKLHYFSKTMAVFSGPKSFFFLCQSLDWPVFPSKKYLNCYVQKESPGVIIMKIKRTLIDFLSVIFENKETRASLVLTFLRDRMANMPASVQTLRISAPETPHRKKANKSQMYQVEKIHSQYHLSPALTVKIWHVIFY